MAAFLGCPPGSGQAGITDPAFSRMSGIQNSDREADRRKATQGRIASGPTTAPTVDRGQSSQAAQWRDGNPMRP